LLRGLVRLLFIYDLCQCEKEFHVGCLRSHKMANLKVSLYRILFSF
jgi:hypothetical protein